MTTVTQLREAHPAFADVDLVKSDTDGYDTGLVPAFARAWAGSQPVLFFEYDPQLTRRVGRPDAASVWAALRELGYVEAVLWDNFGRLQHRTSLADAAGLAGTFEMLARTGAYDYWDVAVRHQAHERAQHAFEELVSRHRHDLR
jgi:hypothetical protein